MNPPTQLGLGLACLASPLADALAAAGEGAVAVERYHSHAAALGLIARADALLVQAQGRGASSTPTADHFAAAQGLLSTEAERT